jgi:hypothetical protein
MKLIAMWLTFCAYLVLSIGGVGFALARFLPEGQGPITFVDVFLFIILGIPLLCLGGVYLGDIFWLITWRHFSNRAEIYKIAGAGRLSRFDHWLIKTLGPKK